MPSLPQLLLSGVQVFHQCEPYVVLPLPCVSGAALLTMSVEACGVRVAAIAGRLGGSPPAAHVRSAAYILLKAPQVFHQVDEPSELWLLAGL